MRRILFLAMVTVMLAATAGPAFAKPNQGKGDAHLDNGNHYDGGNGGGDLVNPDQGNHYGKIKHAGFYLGDIF